MSVGTTGGFVPVVVEHRCQEGYIHVPLAIVPMGGSGGNRTELQCQPFVGSPRVEQVRAADSYWLPEPDLQISYRVHRGYGFVRPNSECIDFWCRRQFMRALYIPLCRKLSSGSTTSFARVLVQRHIGGFRPGHSRLRRGGKFSSHIFRLAGQ